MPCWKGARSQEKGMGHGFDGHAMSTLHAAAIAPEAFHPALFPCADCSLYF